MTDCTDQATVDIPRLVVDIVARVGASTPPAHYLTAVMDELVAMPNAEREPDTLVVRSSEYEIRVGRLGFLQLIMENLATLRSYSLTVAPEVVGCIPLHEENRDGILVLRYAACRGERLRRAHTTSEPFNEAARQRFRHEMQVLADHGKIHPYARGLMHWLVSSETGTLLLAEWVVVRDAEADERRELLEIVDELLARRSQPSGLQRPGGPPPQPVGNRIEEVFGTRRVLLPVVHPVGQREALASVRVAVEAGCKGVFLIDQGMTADQVLALVMVVRREHPALWVGLNLLGRSPAEVLRLGLDACAGRLDGIWSDNAGIDGDGAAPAGAAVAFRDARRERAWTGLYFGGVAFKYQRPVAPERLAAVAATAVGYMDVVCTSGPGTGKAAEVGKVAAMRNGMGAAPALALASGIDEGNVRDYLPYVDAYLVGTGIEHEFGVLDPARVARLQAVLSGAQAGLGR